MPLNLPRPPTSHQSKSDTVTSSDETEFEAFALAQDPLDMQAATWAARRRNGMSADSEAELTAWLEADPRHAEALADMDATLGDVQQLPEEEVVALKVGLLAEVLAPPRRANHAPEPARTRTQNAPESARPVASGLRPWSLGWGQLFPHAAAAALAFSVVGGTWLGWDHWRQLPSFEQTFATVRGRQLTATLPDAGSTMQLDTATRTQVRFYRDRREVYLADGQAMFAVKPDAERPFHVWAGGLRISVVGTRFSVRHTPSGLGAGQTFVAVEEGRVRVTKANPASVKADPETPFNAPVSTTVELVAGQMVVANDAGHLGPVINVPASEISPWRDGRISFDKTPLAQAIAEFERYGPTGLVVRDPAVAALPVGGSYPLHQWLRFKEALPQVLPVRLVRRGEVMEVVAK